MDPSIQQPREEGSSLSTQYEPRFQRTRWIDAGVEFDRFFDRFVPSQYENGFGWRCRTIGAGEQERVVPFESQPEKVKGIIANNAEVLLALFEETATADLDVMRRVGQNIATVRSINPNEELSIDVPTLRDAMSRRHHEGWLSQFNKDIASGRRNDSNHRGAKPFHDGAIRSGHRVGDGGLDRRCAFAFDPLRWRAISWAVSFVLTVAAH